MPHNIKKISVFCHFAIHFFAILATFAYTICYARR